MRRGVLLLLVACACGDPHTATIESEHIVLTHPDDMPLCADTLGYLERTAQAQADLLGIELGTIEYDVWRPDEWSSSPCPQADACTFENRIQSWYPDFTHELVHAMHQPSSVKLIEEGLAVALGDDGTRSVVVDYDPPPADLLRVPVLEFRDYEEAGDFASYLLTRAGAERVTALAAALPADTPPDDRAAAFAAAYGQTIEDVTAERWQSGWRFAGSDLQVPECASDPIARDAAGGFTMAIDCQRDGIGWDADTRPYAAPYMRRHATIDIAADGLYRLEVANDGASLALGYCPLDGPYEAFRIDGLFQAYTAFAYLRAGRYSVSGLASWPGPGRIDVALAPATAPTCDQPLASLPASLMLAPHPSAPLEIALQPATDQPLHILWLRDATLEMCAGCAATCTPLAEDDELTLPAGQPVLFRVTAAFWGGEAILDF